MDLQIDERSIKYQKQNDQRAIKNLTKNYQRSIKNRPCCHLGPKTAPRAKNTPKTTFAGPPGTPKLEAKIHQKSIWRRWKMMLIFWLVLGSIFYRFLFDLGANLGLKMEPKSIKNRYKNQLKKWLHLGLLFDRFLLDFCLILEAWEPWKLCSRHSPVHILYLWASCSWMASWMPFWGQHGSNLASKMARKSMKNRFKNQSKNWLHLGSIFSWFWVDSGPKLGAKLEPSWHQNRKNGGPKTTSKNHKKMMQKSGLKIHATSCG